MRLLGPTLLALASAFLCVVGAGQPAHGKIGAESVRYMAPRTFKCFLSRERRFVRDWLSTMPGSPVELAVIKRGHIGIDSCFGINSDGSRFYASYDYRRMRAGLVRAVLQSGRDKIPEQAPIKLTDSNGQLDDGHAANAAKSASQIGACLVRKDWASVRRMILAVDPKAELRENFPRKVAEREVAAVDLEIAKLIAALPACVPAGARLSVARADLRDLMEEAALHAIGIDALIKVGASRQGTTIDA